MRLANSLFATAGTAGALIIAGLIHGGVASTASRASAASPPAVPAPTQGGFGTIKGRLVFGGARVPEASKVDTKGQEFCRDQKVEDRSLAVDPSTKGVANALAWINAPKGKNPEAEKALVAKQAKVQIDNKNCEFVPRSTAMFKGQQVEFTSSDPVGHNSHVTGFSNGVNVALAAKGKATSKLQAEKRPISLKCDIHPWMQGWILVADHPFFAVTGEDGSFEIAGVPAGAQNLILWQEKVGYVTGGAAKGQAVTVPAGGVVDLGEIKLDPSKIKK